MNKAICFDYCTTYHSCSGWRLEESRIHDPSMKTVKALPSQKPEAMTRRVTDKNILCFEVVIWVSELGITKKTSNAE